MTEDERYEAGLQVRREVLGDAHVDRSLANRTELTTEFQNMITRHAWGDIWTRPGLPRHTRSIATIAMMVALNRSEELALHLRAAKEQRRVARRDQGDPDADCDLLRCAGGQFGVFISRRRFLPRKTVSKLTVRRFPRLNTIGVFHPDRVRRRSARGAIARCSIYSRSHGHRCPA